MKSKKNIFSIKPIKNAWNNEPKSFNKLTDVLISFNLFPFFENKELKELAKVNIKFYNAFVRFYERYKDSNYILYNVKIYPNNNQNNIYEIKDEKGHFIKLSFLNIEHYLIFSYLEWTWKNNERYWYKITPINSLFNKDIYKLRSVTWIDLNGTLSYIFYGKYKLYLNHCVCNLEENKFKMIILLDGIKLEEFIYPSRTQVNRCRSIHNNNNDNESKSRPLLKGGKFRYPRTSKYSKQIDYNPENKLNKDFIMDINVVYDEKMDNNSGHSLTIKFEKRDDSWKVGWLIDGVIVEKIN